MHLRHQGVYVVVLLQLWDQSQVRPELIQGDCFDNELLVLSEEEKAAASSSLVSGVPLGELVVSFENLLAVGFQVK